MISADHVAQRVSGLEPKYSELNSYDNKVHKNVFYLLLYFIVAYVSGHGWCYFYIFYFVLAFPGYIFSTHVSAQFMYFFKVTYLRAKPGI